MSEANLSPMSDLDFAVELAERSVPANAAFRPVSLGGWVAAMAASDVLGSIGIAVALFRLHPHFWSYDSTQLWASLCGFVVAWLTAAMSQSLYGKRTVLSTLREHGLKATTVCAVTFCIILLLGFATQIIEIVSRIWFLGWAIGTFAWVGILRFAWARYSEDFIRKDGCFERALVLAGTGSLASAIGGDVDRESRGRIRTIAVAGIPGTPGGASIDWVETSIRKDMVDRVIVTEFDGMVAETQILLDRLTRVAVDVTVIPSLNGLRGRIMDVGRIGLLPAIDLSLRPLTQTQLVFKRVEDLIIASVILAFTVPAFLIIALAVKLDSRGPILFRQDREGYHGQIFRLLKFRTMYEEASDPGSVQQTSRCDVRVTRVGRVLRRYSLDELPQLINVLRGEMSIVGPRPHALGMTTLGLPMQLVLEQYAARHRLKPGITGLAQVSGCRGEIDSFAKLRRRVSLDCHYIDHWSLTLDLWILFRTAMLVIFDPDAY